MDRQTYIELLNEIDALKQRCDALEAALAEEIVKRHYDVQTITEAVTPQQPAPSAPAAPDTWTPETNYIWTEYDAETRSSWKQRKVDKP